MSYLLDKKLKRKKLIIIAVCGLFLMIVLFWRSPIFRGISFVTQTIFHPVFVIGNGVGSKFSDLASYFRSKSTLEKENEDLRLQLAEKNATLLGYDSAIADNQSMKEILGRKNAKADMILSAILAKPNQSLYDTLIIDGGSRQGISLGKTVFALGDVPVGRIAEVDLNSSKVILFSNPGEKTEVVVGKGIFMEAVGRGGGNFEMVLSKDQNLENGTNVLLPGINNYVLAVVQTTISDPRDSFEKALLVSPVNIQELKFVEVEQ